MTELVWRLAISISRFLVVPIVTVWWAIAAPVCTLFVLITTPFVFLWRLALFIIAAISADRELADDSLPAYMREDLPQRGRWLLSVWLLPYRFMSWVFEPFSRPAAPREEQPQESM